MTGVVPGDRVTRFPVVTIDGPAGAGKSTVARRLAARLGYGYVNSGAIYRAVAWKVSLGAPVEKVLAHSCIEVRGAPESQRVVVDGRDVTEEIVGPRIGELASVLSRRPEVRAYADGIQRARAAEQPVVVEGRDAGSVVFPSADCKFYLDASLEARARRRLSERRGTGEHPELAAIRTALAARDVADQTRAVAPLARMPEATYVDSSEMTVDDVVELLAKEVEQACSTRS